MRCAAAAAARVRDDKSGKSRAGGGGGGGGEARISDVVIHPRTKHPGRLLHTFFFHFIASGILIFTIFSYARGICMYGAWSKRI